MTIPEHLIRQFAAPSAEFSPVPFWFWNDELSREEMIRQIRDFHVKEVDGFVIHPRMGLPDSIPYLSETYMDLVEAAVAEAAGLGMKVILYDEGMYPSGSACGMVVKHNPGYASRGLQVQEVQCAGTGEPLDIPVSLLPGEKLVSVQAVCKLSEGAILPGSPIMLDYGNGSISFSPPDERNWSVLLFIDSLSMGTIRGVHRGQDDGEPAAPPAADLLNPHAVQAFITLTHEKYYTRLSRYFGTTIFAMFTDEPDLLGRGHKQGLKPWTDGFLNEFHAGGGRDGDLPALWFDAGEETSRIRDIYESAVRQRMARTYYKALSDWCQAHGIALTGHPANSDDIGLLEHFHIPGQDVVWRFVAPEADKSLTGVHSTMGKCSSDAARHRGKRRNLNECFGVCGIEGGWSLSADNMKWYLDWLFVRGVNLISPHAFYYSIREERRDERPPDVGPNNIWWPEYGEFSRYIKRMSWLMTDSMNGAETAILAGEAYLPWRIAGPLYRQQIEFNYLEESLLASSCQCRDGMLEIAGYRYKAVLIEEGHRLSPSGWRQLERFAEQGGLIIELTGESGSANDIGQIQVREAEQVPAELARTLSQEYVLEPAGECIRISRVMKEGILFYVIVNEGEDGYEGTLRMKQAGLAQYWRPWTGDCEAATVERRAEGQSVRLKLERRECLIVAVNPRAEGGAGGGHPLRMETVRDLSAGWRILDRPGFEELLELSLWAEWPGMESFSGTVTYEKSVELDEPSKYTEILLDLGEVHEIARVQVNSHEAGVRMWKPYLFNVGEYLQPGTNVLRVSVTNSLANRYDSKSLPSGLRGPVQLEGLSESN